MAAPVVGEVRPALMGEEVAEQHVALTHDGVRTLMKAAAQQAPKPGAAAAVVHP